MEPEKSSATTPFRDRNGRGPPPAVATRGKHSVSRRKEPSNPQASPVGDRASVEQNVDGNFAVPVNTVFDKAGVDVVSAE